LAQNHHDIEVIAINDGSTDDTFEILKQYERAHDNFVLLDQPDIGVARTCNRGISVATGEYVVVVDSDDYIDSDFLDVYLANAHPGCDVVIGGWRRATNEGRLIYERHLKGSRWETYINIYPWSKLYRREFLLANKIEFLDYGIGEDVYFTFCLKAHHARVRVISYVGYTWTHVTTSISNTAHKGLNSDLDVLYLLNKVNDLFRTKPELLKYYFRRFAVWWLLYSGRDASSATFIAEHDRVMNWIRDHDVATKLTPFSKRLVGERLFERALVAGFSVIERLHLLPLFASVYCRG